MVVDISQFLNVGVLAILILILMQLVKHWVRKDLIPYLAILSGVGLGLLFAWVQQLLVTPADLVSYAITGFIAALTAIGGYEGLVDKIKVRAPVTPPSLPFNPLAALVPVLIPTLAALLSDLHVSVTPNATPDSQSGSPAGRPIADILAEQAPAPSAPNPVPIT